MERQGTISNEEFERGRKHTHQNTFGLFALDVKVIISVDTNPRIQFVYMWMIMKKKI